jgi:hypothetical protein
VQGFEATGVAGDEGDAGFGDVESVAEQINQGFVGAVVYGWGGEGDFECAGVKAVDGVPTGSGVEADAQSTAVWGFVGEDQVGHGVALSVCVLYLRRPAKAGLQYSVSRKLFCKLTGMTSVSSS